VPRIGVSVVRVQGLVATKRYGIQVGDALMSDGRTVRFKVAVPGGPIVVRTVGAEAKPGDDAAIEDWFAAQRREA
jgi:hypothetical protein